MTCGALSTLPARFGAQEVNGSPHICSRMRRRMNTAACAASSTTGPNNWEPQAIFTSNNNKLEDNSSSEASSLIALCEDLDWEACVDALRREASAALVKRDEMRSKAGKSITAIEEWDCRQAMSDLRKRASFQAAEELAKKLNTDASCLADHIFLTACQISEDQVGGNGSTKAVAVIAMSVLGGLQGWALANAETITDSSSTTPNVPSWFAPALLGFPVASYLVFNVYRDKVNPQASVMDFLFAMATLFIVGNLVTSATLGVRLY